MVDYRTENFRLFEQSVAETGNTYAFGGDAAIKGIGHLLGIVQDMGLNPLKTAEFRSALFALFSIEIINMPDLENNRFIFAPNHVSDLDAIVMGLLHPRIRIVSKSDWVNNKKLTHFLEIHYHLYGLERTSVQSLRCLLTDSIRYFNDSDENKHYLVFSQGTISDFNHNHVDRISPIAKTISLKTNTPIVPIFLEQVSLHHPTRIVFGEPMTLSKSDDFRGIWLEQEVALQKSLVPPARFPNLSHKHANNNKKGDPFF